MTGTKCPLKVYLQSKQFLAAGSSLGLRNWINSDTLWPVLLQEVIDQRYTDSSLVGINGLAVFACKQLRRKELISVTLEITQKGSGIRLKGQVEKLKQLIL